LMILIDVLPIAQLHLLNLLTYCSKIILTKNVCLPAQILNLMHIPYLQTEIVMLFVQQELMQLMPKIGDVLALALITQLINSMHTMGNVLPYVPSVIGQTLLRSNVLQIAHHLYILSKTIRQELEFALQCAQLLISLDKPQIILAYKPALLEHLESDMIPIRLQ